VGDTATEQNITQSHSGAVYPTSCASYRCPCASCARYRRRCATSAVCRSPRRGHRGRGLHLRRHQDHQEAERALSNGFWVGQGLVFCTRRCTPIRRDNLHDRRWKPLLRRAGLPDIRFHDLRHTCATLLLTKGVHPKIVSEMLGHSSVSITLDTYSHVIPGMGEAAANAMEDALADGDPRVGDRIRWHSRSV
jgi:integrase